MARTFIRQDTQVRNSDLYDDTLAVGATLESGQTTVEGDLNAIRSQAKRALFADNAGDWYADINSPVTFENGAKRGITNLNTDLHELERKRVLVHVTNLNDVVVPAAASAIGTLTATGNFANGETVTTGTKTYTFQTVLTNVDGNVLIGGSASDSLDNLIAAINLGAGSGTLYAAATTANGFVSALAGAGDTMDVQALVSGSGGNTVATTDTATNASWGGATLSGGAGDISILTLGQLPSNTIAAVGAVATRGTVAAYNATFGAHSLAEVAGSTAIAPKNICEVVDGSTRDPILSGGRVIWALFQTETVTDGHTMTGTTPDRAQLSYVRISAAGDDLESVPASDIAGKTINYASVERKALDDLNEQDFLRGAIVDVPSSTTVTRQVAYDNQGTTPVDLTTNATLDLEGAGLTWAIRDDLQANLFRIIEGSAGGTSQVSIDADVDTFNVDAAVNDFAEGIRVDSAGQRINIGETAGLIESTGSDDLRILGAGELYLDDGNQTGSTWAQTSGIKLSETTQEWSDFETKFGEVSLLNAIMQGDERKPKVYSNVTTNTNEDLDVSLADGNLDTALPDMSVGSFLSDYDVFLNGSLLRPGADASANHDYYPGTSLVTAAQLKFEFKVKSGDVLCVIPYV
jgi:hypothetical protein